MILDPSTMDEIEEVGSLDFCDGPSTSRGDARRRQVKSENPVDPALADLDLFPEFKSVLGGEDSVDEDSEGCPLPGTPEEESLMDPKVSLSGQQKVIGHDYLL